MRRQSHNKEEKMSKSSKGRKSNHNESDHPSTEFLTGGITEYNYDALPAISDEKWIEIIKTEAEDNAYYSILHEVFLKSQEQVRNEYLKLHVYPFTVMCCHIAFTKIINMYFQRRDPGEPSEKYGKVWKEDREPSPSPADSWSSHSIPVLTQPITGDCDTLATPLQSKYKKFIENCEVSDRQSPLITLENNRQQDTISLKKEPRFMPLDKQFARQSKSSIKSDKRILMETFNRFQSSSQKTESSYEPNKNSIVINDLDNDIKSALKGLFGEEDYTKIVNEKLPISFDLIDIAVKDFKLLTDTQKLTDDILEHSDIFYEEEEFGFCFNDNDEFSVESIWGQSKPCEIKQIKSDKYKEQMFYQKFNNDPVILNENLDVRTRVKALSKQYDLFSSNTLERVQPKEMEKFDQDRKKN